VDPDPRLLAVKGEPPRWLRSSAAEGAIRLRLTTRAGAGLGITYSGYLHASRRADVFLNPAWLDPVARTIAQACGGRRRTGLPGAAPSDAGLSQPIPQRLVPSLMRTTKSAFMASAAAFCRRRPIGHRESSSQALGGWRRTTDGARPRPWIDSCGQRGKVVFLGFGSVMDAWPGKLNTVVEEALARLGCRAILLAGPAGQLDLPPSPRRLAVRDVPLDWLFRRVDAIVHHGGAGTTALAARAGKPSITIPFFGDQLFWGQRIHRAGGGARPIPRRAFTSKRLVSAIDEALHDPRSAERAARLGTRFRAETGLSTAVQLIEARGLG
jgi:hypothetical protein